MTGAPAGGPGVYRIMRAGVACWGCCGLFAALSMTTLPDPIGLCRRCVHARPVPSRTSLYWRCALAEDDARFERYPRLPVLRCEGFTPATPGQEPGTKQGPDEDPPGP